MNVIDGWGFVVGFATRINLGEIRAIFTLGGYENDFVAMDDGVAIVEARCTGPEKIKLMFTEFAPYPSRRDSSVI